MNEDDLVREICGSLGEMDRAFWELSRVRMTEVHPYKQRVLESYKVQERPVAYEFFHKFRSRWQNDARLQEFVIQAEVNKSYQCLPALAKMPDFLLHEAGRFEPDANVAVIEFKMANRVYDFVDDLEKLEAFRIILRYRCFVEVLIGTNDELQYALEHIHMLSADSSPGEPTPINIVCFSIESGAVEQTKRVDFRSHWAVGLEELRAKVGLP